MAVVVCRHTVELLVVGHRQDMTAPDIGRTVVDVVVEAAGSASPRRLHSDLGIAGMVDYFGHSMTAQSQEEGLADSHRIAAAVVGCCSLVDCSFDPGRSLNHTVVAVGSQSLRQSCSHLVEDYCES